MNEHASELSRITWAIRRRWVVILAITVGVVAVAFGVTKLVKPRYETTALVSYGETQAQDGGLSVGSVLPSTGDPTRDLQTLVTIAGSQDVLKRASAAIGNGMTPAQLMQSVSVQVDGKSSIIDFTATGHDKALAQTEANAYAAALVADREGRLQTLIKSQLAPHEQQIAATKPSATNADLISGMKSALANLTGQASDDTSSLSVVDEAVLPVVPVRPKTKLMLLVGFLVGLGLGVGFALVSARTDPRVDEHSIGDLPAPVIVQVPRPNMQSPAVLGPGTAGPLLLDAYAALGSRITADPTQTEGRRVILVTSACADEGKSSVAANLSMALARSGRRVVLIDADLRKPSQQSVFPEVRGRDGLAQLLTGTSTPDKALTLVAPNLALIGAGQSMGSPSTLLSSLSCRMLVDRLSAIADIIVIDAPPVLPVPDATTLAQLADDVLICARVDFSRHLEQRETFNRLRASSRAPMSAVILGTAPPVGYGYGGAGDIAPFGQPQIGFAADGPDPWDSAA